MIILGIDRASVRRSRRRRHYGDDDDRRPTHIDVDNELRVYWPARPVPSSVRAQAGALATDAAFINTKLSPSGGPMLTPWLHNWRQVVVCAVSNLWPVCWKQTAPPTTHSKPRPAVGQLFNTRNTQLARSRGTFARVRWAFFAQFIGNGHCLCRWRRRWQRRQLRRCALTSQTTSRSCATSVVLLRPR